MQKKVFLQRNIRKGGGGSSYLKYLVVATVCLVFLVVAASYFSKGKNKEITKRPVPERGTITKEIPKALEPPTPVKPPEEVNPVEPVKPSGVETAPEAVAPPEVQPPPKPPEPDSNLAISNEAAPEAPIAPEKAPAVEPAPRDLFPKKTVPSGAPPAAAPKASVKPGAKTASVTPAAKPPSPAGKGNYAVQVGTTFKDRLEAETLRRDLARKGYSAVVRPAKNGSGYCVTTSPTIESKAYTLQVQMKIQGWSTTTVIRVAPVTGTAQKPAPGMPATHANGGHSGS